MVNEEDDDKKSKGPKRPNSRLRLLIISLVVLFFYYTRSGSNQVTDEITDAELEQLKAQNQEAIKEAKKKKRNQPENELASNLDIIESGARTGWTVYLPPLVQKRPARECEIKFIAPQVEDPLVYLSKMDKKSKKKWKRRAYACVYSAGKTCHSQVEADFEDRRWKKITKPRKHKEGGFRTWDATFVLTDWEMLEKLRVREPETFYQLYYEREGTTYLNALVGAEDLGGSLNKQFASRRRLADRGGCKFNLLKIQSPHYDTSVDSDCVELETSLAKSSDSKKIFVVQKFVKGQDSPEVLTSSSISSGKNPCKDGSTSAWDQTPTIVWEGMSKPLLLPQKRSFDVRSYMLIGSTMPFMVFFRRGYIRTSSAEFRSSNKNNYEPHRFDKSTEFMSLAEFQTYLAHNKIAGGHYVDTLLVSAMKQIALFTFHAARQKIERRRGSFQLFSIDFVLDELFHIYLEKVTAEYDFGSRKVHEDAPDLVSEMHDLVMELHEIPVAFEGMIKGDKYGDWELLFSELIESCHKIPYNPCHSFFEFNSRDLRKANKKVGKVHNTANRERHEHDRVKKKAEEQKRDKCKDKKISYPSSKCDKMAQAEADAKFVRLFDEHEKDYNPNYFELPRLGEVFPWEKV